MPTTIVQKYGITLIVVFVLASLFALNLAQSGVAMKTSVQERKKAIPPLDNIRLVEKSDKKSDLPECNSVFSRLYHAIGTQSGEICEINCKSWRCPRHCVKWGKKQGSIICWQLERTPATLLVNLTTSEPKTSYGEIATALRYFFRKFRLLYGKTEYVKFVEAARKNHSLIHFHLILINQTIANSLPPKPEDWPNKLSWPDEKHSPALPLFETIRDLWTESMLFASPLRTPSTVVWCQPPSGNGQKAANYAVGYLTGKRGLSKDEQPDETWRGRKFTYSKGFFSKPTREIWAELLLKWFGPKENILYHWQLKTDLSLPDLTKVRTGKRRFITLEGDKLKIPCDYTDLEKLAMFEGMPIIKERRALADYYKQFGYFPTATNFDLREYAFEAKDGYFDIMRT